MEITELLKQMKEADKPRIEAKAESRQHPKNKKKSTITNKQRYLKGLMGRRR